MDSKTHSRLPCLGPTTVVELRALHLHRQLTESPLTIEVATGEYRINQSLMPLARRAHASLLAGVECPARGPLKEVLEALAGDCEASNDVEASSQGEETTDAVEALCNRLAVDALGRVEAILLKTVRAKFASEREGMVESVLQTVAEEC